MIRLLVTGAGGASGYAVASAAQHREMELLWGDCDHLSPSLLKRPELAVLLPSASSPEWVQTMEVLCRERGVTHLSVNVDAELRRLADIAAEPLKRVVQTWLPDATGVLTCIDKAAFAEALSRFPELRTPRAYESPSSIPKPFPMSGVFLKPRCGSGGAETRICRSLAEVDAWLLLFPEALIQERLVGPEFSADCIYDGVRDPIVYLRRRSRTKGGMSSVTETLLHDGATTAIGRLLKTLQLVGPTCVQGFLVEDCPVFTEVNVRFGGGCGLATYQQRSLVDIYLDRLIWGTWPALIEDDGRPPLRRLIRTHDYSIIEMDI